MEVRSYYATTVEAAINLARKELGSDAMLIQSQPTTAEFAHLGRYEVVFAGELQIQKPSRSQDQKVSSRAETPAAKPQAASKGAALNPKRVAPPAILETRYFREAAPELGPVDLVSHPSETGVRGLDFASLLESAGVDRELSREFFDGAVKSIPSQPVRKETTRGNLADDARSARRGDHLNPSEPSIGIECNPTLGRDRARAVAALIGPPGSGKTLTIMKLAIQFGLAASRSVRMIALDPHRVCGTAQIRGFASLLNLPFHELDTFADLHKALNQPFSGLTLIDTPGYSRSETEPLSELGRLIQSRSEIETHLTIRADIRAADILAAVERFSLCEPKRLILTALDETEDHSDLRRVIEAARLPLSFLGTGPAVPEDLEAARATRLANLIARGWNEFARAAA